MSRSLRFLGLAVAAWAGVRAVSLGLVPGTTMLAIDRPAEAAERAEAAPALPPVERTDLTPPELSGQSLLLSPAAAGSPPAALPSHDPAAHFQPANDAFRPIAAGMTSAAAFPSGRPRRTTVQYTELQDIPGLPYAHGAVPALDEWPLSRIASARHRPAPEAASTVAPRFDRLQLTSWAMVRQRSGAAALATDGMLGASQAGMRLSYRFNRQFAASLRTSVPLGGATRGGEAALGLRVQPFATIPIAVTVERRQKIGRDGGRSAFALFAEGGLWQRPVAAGFALDAYVQGGVVGMRRRDLFVDGAATLTRPLWRNLSLGGGAWGGAQPGLDRLDVGPRLSIRMRRGFTAHVDYRYRALGNARPRSGVVVTLAGDF